LRFVLGAAVFFALFGAGGAFGGGLASITQNGELRVAIEAQDWGFFHFQSGDAFEGLEVDLAERVAEALGVACVIVPLPWGDGEPGSITGILQKGLWPEDVHMGLAGIAVTEERMKQVLFSDPYFTAGQAVLLPQGSGIVSPSQMQGMTVSFQSGTTSAVAAAKISKINLLPFTTWPEAFEALQRGESQAAIVDSPLAFQIMKDHEGYTILDVLLTREYYGAFFPLDADLSLVGKVNDIIREQAWDLRDRWMPYR
jgi:ABC-type amino acid transport substrate-binding protein